MGLRLRFVWLVVVEALTAPVRWLDSRAERRRQHERELAQIAADGQARVFEALARSNAEMVRELGAVMAESTKPMMTWLEGFKTVQVPASQVITEATELGWEADEAKEVLEKRRLEDRELFLQAWPDDGRLPPPVGPDFFHGN
jgi:hypothetical protein